MKEPGPPGAGRADRRPAALLPAPVARLGGFAALALLGALEWRRMVGGLSVGWAVLWVLAAVGTAIGVLWAQSPGVRRPAPAPALLLVTAAGFLSAFAVSGLDLGLLRPRRWAELADGLDRGAETLGSVRLPYVGADPWPGLTLQLVGASLCVLAALVAFWPRERSPGYPFLALAVLLVLVAAPVVSLGGTRQVALGVVLAALTVCFLWLERLPLRPGLGVAVLLALAVAGALPLASVADGEEPWFDYKTFAEGLGPADPLRFDWNQAYGPMDWPRDGNEVLRVASAQPAYWKVRNLEEFDGLAWRDRGPGSGRSDPSLDLAADWRLQAGWNQKLTVTVRRLRTTDVIGAGTLLRVRAPGHSVRTAGEPGMWRADTEFERGDSYTVEAHVPRPTAVQLVRSTAGADGSHADDRAITVPFNPGARAPHAPQGPAVTQARVVFAPFAARGEGPPPRAEYPTLGRVGSGRHALRSSPYLRTWRLAQRLERGAATPFAYVRAVDRYLERGFVYDEAPPAPAAGRAPLDAFLFDSKSGYCQHFSGAMALLLRMGGIPARVVAGFSPGGFSKRKQAWIVRDTDAHAWVEAWFDEWGWVTFDPTPDGTPARSQIAALDETPQGGDAGGGGAGGAEGDGGASDSRQGQREDLFRDPAAARGGAGGSGGGGASAWWQVALAVAFLLALATWVLAWLRRRTRTAVAPLDRAVAELELALRRSGRPAPVGTTLHQLEQRFGGSSDAAAYFRALRAGRYGPGAPRPTAAQRRALRHELAAGLGPAGWLRALWALPPWRS